MRGYASRQPVGTVLLDRERPTRPPAVAIAVNVAQDRVMHAPPARRRPREYVLDQREDLEFVPDAALMARTLTGASELAAPDHHRGADDPRSRCVIHDSPNTVMRS